MEDKKEYIPFVAFSNEELSDCELVEEEAICNNCGEKHKVVYGERVLEDGSRVPSKLLSFVKCDKNGATYLVGIEGKLLKFNNK